MSLWAAHIGEMSGKYYPRVASAETPDPLPKNFQAEPPGEGYATLAEAVRVLLLDVASKVPSGAQVFYSWGTHRSTDKKAFLDAIGVQG